MIIGIIIYNILLIIYLFNGCFLTFFHNRWKKNTAYDLLKNKYNMSKQLYREKPINKLPEILSYPVVLKPVDSGKGNDVYMDVNTNFELQKISFMLIKKYGCFVIEEQVNGYKEARVLIDNRFNDLSITRRLDISLTGDGYKTLEELSKIKSFQCNNDYHPVVIDERLVDKKYIPKNGETVVVNKRRNSSLGGKVEIIDINKVHPENIKIFKKILIDIKSSFNGLDIFYKDLSKPYNESGIMLLETNFCPGINKKRLFSKDFQNVRNFIILSNIILIFLLR